MDSSGQQQRQAVPPLILRTERIERVGGDQAFLTRFEPPVLADRGRRNDEYSQRMAQALDEARQQGLRAAQQHVDAVIAAHEAARQQMEAATRALGFAIDRLADRDEAELVELQRQAVQLGIELCEELIGRELEATDSVVLGAIERAMRLAPDRGIVVLRVNPASAAAARQLLMDSPEIGGRAELVADGQVAPGGCVAVIGPLRIDAQIAPALERIREAIAVPAGRTR